MPSNFFSSLVFAAKKVGNKLFLNSIEFNTFSGSLASQLLDHLSQFLVLKDFYHKTLINSNDVLQQNYRFFNNNKFKNELNDISWDNISPDNASASLVFDLFLARKNTLLDAPKYKLSKKNITES